MSGGASEASFRSAVERMRQTSDQAIEGKTAVWNSLCSQRDDATIAGARCEYGRGWGAMRQRCLDCVALPGWADDDERHRRRQRWNYRRITRRVQGITRSHPRPPPPGRWWPLVPDDRNGTAGSERGVDRRGGDRSVLDGASGPCQIARLRSGRGSATKLCARIPRLSVLGQ